MGWREKTKKKSSEVGGEPVECDVTGAKEGEVKKEVWPMIIDP